MVRTAPARARLTALRTIGRIATLACVVAAAAPAAADVVAAPITGGAPTNDYAAVGAFLVGGDPGSARTDCSGTLIGCQTFITAAHCVCPGTGVECQDAAAPSPAGRLVFFPHAGFVSIESITVHPEYVFPVADVAVIRLAEPVTAIPPARLNDVAAPAFGTAGTIVGFGWQTTSARDTGIKRVGSVATAPCASGISNDTSVCWDYKGPGANTCQGDSGGPLFVDLGTGPVIAGTTSGGFAINCQATDHSYDANLFVFRDWITLIAGGDVGTSGCGGIPTVGGPGTVTTAFTGDLAPVRPFALESIGVAPGTAELRVAMQGSETALTDFDLYVRGGAPPAEESFDCVAAGTGQYGFCRIANPTAGSWFLRAERVLGEGLFQIVATTIGGQPSVCGNGIREPGERCDGSDVGTCTTGCDGTCGCVECMPTDLDVRQIELAPRVFVQATLGDGTGTYTAVDPATAGLSIELLDASRAVPLEIPPRDPRWVIVNPKRGRYRWKGEPGSPVRKILFRIRPKQPTTWAIVMSGKNLPGANALDFQTLIVRIRIGNRCAERRFHVEETPGLPRR